MPTLLPQIAVFFLGLFSPRGLCFVSCSAHLVGILPADLTSGPSGLSFLSLPIFPLLLPARLANFHVFFRPLRRNGFLLSLLVSCVRNGPRALMSDRGLSSFPDFDESERSFSCSPALFLIAALLFFFDSPCLTSVKFSVSPRRVRLAVSETGEFVFFFFFLCNNFLSHLFFTLLSF